MAAVLECVGVEKQYKDFVLKPVNFVLEAGYLTGLIGINGAGKTTLINILSGLDRKFCGDVMLDGISLKRNPSAVKQRVSLVSERITFFLDKTPLENGQILGKYFDNWSMEEFYVWMDRLEIPKGKQIYQFSKGMKMKFQLCFAMAHRTEFILMDEPTAGFDPVFRRDFLRILQDIMEKGTGILMSTHITGDLDNIADYILLLDHGELKINDTREALEDKVKRETIQGYMEKRLHIGELLKRNGDRKNDIL